MITAGQRRSHLEWLLELTSLPTAAGHEGRVVSWVTKWVSRRRNLRLRRDRAGNLLITRAGRHAGRPLYLTAHLDHPAFVVVRTPETRTVELEFRGGVHDAYFKGAAIDVFDAADRRHRARVVALDAAARPFKRVTARLARPATTIAAGDVGRWALRGHLPRVARGLLHTHACDDLAGVAAALSALDVLRRQRRPMNVGILLTRAEEVGFIGALAACRERSVSRTTRLICIENSRSFPESPIGGGPILRVGDKVSVFDPDLTNRIAAVLARHQVRHPSFRWQRKLMPGGTCEATAFGTYGYASTCVCLPLGNYHNMTEADEVRAGKRPARVGAEHIALADYHGLVEMLVVCATKLDDPGIPPLKAAMDELVRTVGHVIR